MAGGLQTLREKGVFRRSWTFRGISGEKFQGRNPKNTGYGFVSHQPKGKSRQWVSDPRRELPQSVTVGFAETREASEIRVVFDSDFFLPSKWVHHRVPSTLARLYKVEISADGIAWETVADVKVNRRRLDVHRFAPKAVRQVRVTVSETYGAPSARVFEIGVW